MKTNNDKKITRREALKRMGMIAGGSVLAFTGGSSLFALLSGCKRESESTPENKYGAAAYNDSFPENVSTSEAEKVEMIPEIKEEKVQPSQNKHTSNPSKTTQKKPTTDNPVNVNGKKPPVGPENPKNKTINTNQTHIFDD